MKNQNRHILLLIDNAPCHRIDEELHLTNVTIHPLPENTTAHLQPCDAEIICSFKVQTIRLVLNLSLLICQRTFQAKYYFAKIASKNLIKK